ncbi:MAG: DUF2130 domain-containing protein, partial [Rhodothermales bacterium]
MTSSDSIECPKCGYTIDVSSALTERLRKENEAALAKERMALKKAEETLAAREADFEEVVARQLSERMATERKALKAELEKETADQVKSMQEELQEKSAKVKELNLLKAEHGKLERQMQEMAEEYEARAQQKIAAEVQRVKAEAVLKAEESAQMKLKEREKTIVDLRDALKAANQRAEQGSMQLQGEVQELAIEEWLQETFPLDTIEEIKKGARGGDCVQQVNTRSKLRCGTIYYESKRTKTFQPAWIGKFKEDMREKGADIGVLVTEAMPSDMDAMGQVDGIWVCTFAEFKSLAVVLRRMVIELDMAVESSHNRGEKMGMLYDYMTGPEFKLTIESIVEGIASMHADLESEKRSMRRIWKKREKQIEKVVLSTTDMYG